MDLRILNKYKSKLSNFNNPWQSLDIKKLMLVLYILLLCVIFSSLSNADWKQMWNSLGDTYYVDFDRIRKQNGYVYYWQLLDYLKPDEYGHFSSKAYTQGDCKMFRFKFLNSSLHKERMGSGDGEVDNTPDNEWTYPFPNSVFKDNLKSVCEYAKNMK